MRLADLRDAMGATPETKRIREDKYLDAFQSGRLVPLADLIAGPGWGDDRVKDADVVFRYAQSWALVYYLHHEYKAEFSAYLQLLSRRRPGEAVGSDKSRSEFRTIFGQPDDPFQRKWLSYMLNLRLDRKGAGR